MLCAPTPFLPRVKIVAVAALRELILQWLGIPCCVRIGQTKTLVKLANGVAKEVMPLGQLLYLRLPGSGAPRSCDHRKHS